MRACIAVFALAGCQSVFGLKDPDRLPDSSSTVVPECWGTDINVCVRPPATESRILAGTLDTGSMCDVVEDDLCIVAGTEVRIDFLRVTGPRPLVVIASAKLSVIGFLDAASHRTGANPDGPGVGAANAACNSAAGPSYAASGTGTGGGGGGGAGGTFSHAGGGGGGSVAAAAKGMPAAPATAAFRAGCSGQNGGIKAGVTTVALGGKGGGAVYLVSSTRIYVSGVINASGAAGDSGKCTCAPTTSTADLQNAESYGGAGGGSGGAIILEAPTIEILTQAIMFADGGGGGQGASRSTAGEAGAESQGTTAALGGRRTDDGGTGPSNGGPGGPGSNGALKVGMPGGNGLSSNIGGGGGGGGGAGYIKMIGSVTNMGRVSPSS
ncbi:MAG: hypothetical protein M4D80_35905 [Myxococcota bacterium]|nr:hypothetical protein [Myxococcota bacterium]